MKPFDIQNDRSVRNINDLSGGGNKITSLKSITRNYNWYTSEERKKVIFQIGIAWNKEWNA